MIVILCVDNRGGMLFHNRRLSQDRVLRKHILADAKGGKLWMNAYSASQFEAEDQSQLIIAEDFLEQAGKGAVCFVENQDINPYAARIERLIRYCWNRDYPADVHFTFDLTGWRLAKETEFQGYSHEKLTRDEFILKKHG